MNDGVTPLMWAASMDHYDICVLLINAGANVNKTDTADKMTPLIYASQGRYEVSKLLIEKGA